MLLLFSDFRWPWVAAGGPGLGAFVPGHQQQLQQRRMAHAQQGQEAQRQRQQAQHHGQAPPEGLWHAGPCGLVPPPRQRLETLSLILSRRYVQGSQAIWVAPLDAVRQDLRQGDLVELDLGMREPGGSVGLCSNPALPLTSAAQWCAQVLREVGEEYRGGHYP